MNDLKVFRLNESAILPKLATAGSACFDVSACFESIQSIKAYSLPLEVKSMNFAWSDEEIPIKQFDHEIEVITDNSYIKISPFQRALIPTGLKFDIPEGYSLRLHPRSGAAFKQGLSLVNCEGVIDADYVEELFVAVVNLNKNTNIDIFSGDRIAQCELVKNVECSISEIDLPPVRKTTRAGGFGSTGK
jgi:dUTP pyrophosphatase